MSFDEIVDAVCDQLNLTTAEAIARVGKRVNRRYRRVATHIGLALDLRRVSFNWAVTEDSRVQTITGAEKIIAVVNADIANSGPLDELSYEEMLSVIPTTGAPSAYAVKRIGANSVTLIFDTSFADATNLTVVAEEGGTTLSGAQVPAFPESWHDILYYGALAEELKKKEKVALARDAEAEYERMLGQLALNFAVSAYKDVVQGKRNADRGCALLNGVTSVISGGGGAGDDDALPLYFLASTYGAIGDGVVDDTVAIQAALTAAAASDNAIFRTVLLDQGTYIVSQLSIPSGVTLRGSGVNASIVKSSTGSWVVRLSGTDRSGVADLTIQTTSDAGIAIRITAGSRWTKLSGLFIQGTNAATNTGKGIHMDASADDGWIGGVEILGVYILGHKYGIYLQGGDPVLGYNVTEVLMDQVWLVGRSAGVIVGGAGIYLDSKSNATDVRAYNLLIEDEETGILHITGTSSFGGYFYGAFEGNTTDYTVGASFNGEIINHHGHQVFRQGTNGTANRWLAEKNRLGIRDVETYYDQRHTIYNGDPTSGAVWAVYGGATGFIDGGSPTFKAGFHIHPTSTSFEKNVLRIQGNRLGYHNVSPNAGTWAVGDVVWNTAAAIHAVAGWVCTVAGTPGTWITIPSASPWQAVAYAAGNFTASAGTWTVDAGDQIAYAYTVIGKTMTLSWRIASTDVSNTPVTLRLAIPGGFVSARYVEGVYAASDNGAATVAALCRVQIAGTYVELLADLSANGFSVTAADNTTVAGTLTFEVQ